MSKRPLPSRGAQPQARRLARSEAASEPASPKPPFNRPARAPGFRQYLVLAVAAGAFVAWLTLLTVMAFF